MKNKKLQKEFIKVFASCEGYIKFNTGKWITRRITIGCKHPGLKRQVRKILANCSIETKENENEILIYGKENLKKFASIGFVEGCKIHKGKHKDVERNSFLNEMLESYPISSRA